MQGGDFYRTQRPPLAVHQTPKPPLGLTESIRPPVGPLLADLAMLYWGFWAIFVFWEYNGEETENKAATYVGKYPQKPGIRAQVSALNSSFLGQVRNLKEFSCKMDLFEFFR